jgi:hypothetical protein
MEVDQIGSTPYYQKPTLEEQKQGVSHLNYTFLGFDTYHFLRYRSSMVRKRSKNTRKSSQAKSKRRAM